MRRSIWFIGLCWFGAAVLYAQEPDLGTEAQRAAGQTLYLQKCAQCHGEAGDGRGVGAPYFNPLPRDFTTGVFKVRTTASGELPSDQDLKNVIRKGMPYTGMPPWPTLTEAQLANLVYHIKTFSSDFAGPYGVVEPIPIPRAPRFSEESARQGRAVYEANQCYDCHGNQGRGDGPSAPTLEDDKDNHIRPADLTKRWTFIGGSTRQDIYRTFTTGLDGTPMPSYDIPPEERWALVDYVYSLSRDDPNYGTVAVAKRVEGDLDLSQGTALFEEAPSAYFPVAGQVIEPGRAFYPGVDGIAVRAVYNDDEIAVLLTWHDMVADRSGANSPAMAVSEGDSAAADTAGAAAAAGGPFSDAVAIQIPVTMPEGAAKPYFLFGDGKNPVEIWFADLAGSEAELFLGRGSGSIEPAAGDVALQAAYEEGAWTAVFKRARVVEEGLSFEPGRFVPIAFSVWDGFNQERGNKRGITSWYHVYLEPAEAQSAALPMLRYGLLALLLELGLIYAVRRNHRKKAVTA